MSPSLRSSLSVFIVALAATAPSAHAAPDRFEVTRQRIDALLGGHRRSTPLPEKPANPFYFAPAVVPSAASATPDPAGPVLADDDRILAYCAARLRISGQVLRGGVAHLLINSATYREGDLIPVRGTGDTVYYVKIEHVRAHEVVFGYNEAFLAVPLRN